MLLKATTTVSENLTLENNYVAVADMANTVANKEHIDANGPQNNNEFNNGNLNLTPLPKDVIAKESSQINLKNARFKKKLASAFVSTRLKLSQGTRILKVMRTRDNLQ